MPRLVISYRREDTAPYAGRLYDRLSDTFGRDAVFMDVDAIRPGEDFVATIERALSEADVLLALIGPRWAEVADASGTRRIDDPADYVRTEIGTALARGMRVIPVLVGGATAPTASDLPDDLAPLARRQAYRVGDGRFHADVDDLTKFLRSLDPDAGREQPASARDPLPAASASEDRVSDRDRCELEYQRLARSPLLEGNLLWSLGMLTAGLYYFFVASALARGIQRLFASVRGVADGAREIDGDRAPPAPATLLPGVAAHAAGWLLAIWLAYAMLAGGPGFELWVDELLAAVSVGLLLGSAWLLGWLWLFTRATAAQFAGSRGRLPACWPGGEDAPRWQAIHLQKMVAFLLMFAFEAYLLVMLERAAVGALVKQAAPDGVFRFVVVMIVLPVTLLQAGHCLFKDMAWKLLRYAVRGISAPDRRVPLLARVRHLSWFWPWMYANAAAAVFAFYLVHEAAIELLLFGR